MSVFLTTYPCSLTLALSPHIFVKGNIGHLQCDITKCIIRCVVIRICIHMCVALYAFENVSRRRTSIF